MPEIKPNIFKNNLTFKSTVLLKSANLKAMVCILTYLFPRNWERLPLHIGNPKPCLAHAKYVKTHLLSECTDPECHISLLFKDSFYFI